MSEKKGISRRKFMGFIWLSATAVVAMEFMGGALAALWPNIEEGDAEKLLNAGNVDDFEVGKVVVFQKEKVLLYRATVGFLAFSNICTHLRCIVQWNESKNEFECPCHGAAFNTFGEVTKGPPPRPMDLHPVKIVDNKVVVDTSKLIKREKFDASQAVKA